jgi:hypothetical protein
MLLHRCYFTAAKSLQLLPMTRERTVTTPVRFKVAFAVTAVTVTFSIRFHLYHRLLFQMLHLYNLQYFPFQ